MLDAKSRLDMVKLAIQGHPNYTVTDREIQKGGLSYTYLTINELKAEEPDTEFYFLMGADSLADFRKWSHAEVIASKCHILAAMRDELGDEDVKQIADELSLEYQEDIRMGNSISGKVPKAVEDYILIHRLYSQKQNTEG